MDNQKFFEQVINIIFLGITLSFVVEMARLLWWIQDGKKVLVFEPNSTVLLVEILLGMIVICYVSIQIAGRFLAIIEQTVV